MNYRNLNKSELIDRVRMLENQLEELKGKDRLSSLLDNIRTIVVVTDGEGVLHYTTPSFEWTLGYEEEDLKKARFIDYIHPEDRKRVEDVLRMVLNSDGSSLIFPEFRFQHKRGAWIYLEGDITNQMHDASLKGLVLNLYDVTQRKLFEVDYARLLGAIRISTDSFLLSDNEGNIIFVNDATMKLLESGSKNEIIGRNISSFISEGEFKELSRAVRYNQGQIKSVEHRFVTSTGRTIPVESSIAVMKDSNRQDIGLVYITRDITERKRVEAEIVQYRYHLEEIVEARTAELNQSMGKLRTTLDGIVVSMGYALESRDQYTAGHQHRVAEVASEIARVMGLPDNTIEGIRMAGLIHDIGKIYVPSEILNKHGKLDEVEFMLIKKHPQVGYDILKSIDFPWPIAQIVYQHHEKMNGSGYPRGLKDGEILLEAKIICVADVIEAMTIDRPYKGGVGIEGALEEIEKNRGELYDPAVVDSCMRLFKEKGYRFT
ncbi:MAG TPA: PAS domain S-box protein [Spirochaetota bacterium]|nr:PAS domain S-box protein [Spirochaetota bacterium]HOD16652.1 PAS domain S-box protein [Spirochaetota bacterium]HQL81588.1 PAS domain S-box protein [Spirochaetota bacterium]